MKYLSILFVSLAFVPSVFAEKISEEDQDALSDPMTTTAKTTLLNLKTDTFTPEEEAFLDAKWIEAYGVVHNDEDYLVDSVSILQKTSHLSTNQGNRFLRRRLAYVEDIMFLIGYRCQLCNDDDWYFDFYYYYNNRRLSKLQQTKKQLRRKHRKFEKLLCKLLRSGSFDTFKHVRGCSVTFTEK